MKEVENTKEQIVIEEKNKELALAALAFSIISIFVFPILGIVGVILGTIVIGTNENTESWITPIWKCKNKALGYGRLALIWGIIDIIYIFFSIA